MEWSTACVDWEERIVKDQSLIPFAPLFPEEAEAALAIFKALKLVDVAGQPTMDEIARDWVLEFVAAIFGAYDPTTARRLINEFFLLIAKKNMKSTTAAGIMTTALLRNWRHSAEFIILAPTLEIAKNSAEPAMDMVRSDSRLRKLLKPIAHHRTIEHLTTGATLKIVAADSETVGGKKATGVLIEELWLFGKKASAEDMLREAIGGLAARPEGFVIALSTQSDDPPAGVFLDWLKRFRQIRDGKITAPRSLGVLYEYPEAYIKNESFKDPATWYIPNPNLGASVDEQFLRDEHEKAQLKGPKSLVGFYAKHLDIEIGGKIRSDNWPGAEFWARRADKNLTLDEVIDRSEVIVVGIDGGGLDDLFGLTVLGRSKEVKRRSKTEGEEADEQLTHRDWFAWSHAWCHKGVLERRQSIASRLQDFEKAGELTIVDDELDDVSEIVEIVKKIKDAELLAAVAVDPAGIGEFIDALALIEVTAEDKQVIGAPQGVMMMTAIKTAERKLANGTLWHSGSSCTAWAVGNLKIEPTATAIRATKQHAGDLKVDPAISLFNAVTVMQTNPSAHISVYEGRDIVVV